MVIAEFLGLKRNIVILLGAVVLIGAGEETWMRFVPKYLESLGAGVLLIGLFDALKTLLGAVYAYPGGVAADRLGHRKALVAFNAISIGGYAIAFAVPHPAAVIGAMFLFLAWSALSLPAMFSLVGSNLPENKRAMGIGVQSLVKRLPILIGPVIGGLLIDGLGVRGGVRAGFGVSIMLGSLSLLLQSRIMETRISTRTAGTSISGLVLRFPPELKRLLLSDVLIRFCERIPHAWVVIYCMDRAGVTATEVGLLTAIEMLAAIVCFVPTAYLADRYGKEPFVIATFVFFTLFPLALLLSHSFAALTFAFAIRGLKEFGEPARKALIISYSPESERGGAIGAYYLIRDVVVTIGSFLGAALWRAAPEANFGAAAALGAAGTLYYCSTLRHSQ
jgi:MFS family permease